MGNTSSAMLENIVQSSNCTPSTARGLREGFPVVTQQHVLTTMCLQSTAMKSTGCGNAS